MSPSRPSCAMSRIPRARSRAARRQRRARAPHHHSPYTEDRPGAVRVRRVPPAGTRAGLRQQRSPIPRNADRRRNAREALRRVFSHELPCLLVTGGATPAAGNDRRSGSRRRAAAADRARPRRRRCRGCPPCSTRYLAERGMVHGVLMDILGLGVLSSARAASARANARWISSSAATGWWPTTPSSCGAARSRS